MSPKALKMNALVIIGANAMLVVLLMIFVAPGLAGTKGTMGSSAPIAMAALPGLAALYCALYRLPPPGPLPSPQQFQTHLVIALALAELVTLIGLFLGAGSVEPWPFVMATLVIILGFILPKTLRYYQLSG